MKILLEKNMGYKELPDAELLHMLCAENLPSEVIWRSGKKWCIEIHGEKDPLDALKRLALWQRAFVLLARGSLEEIVSYASGISVGSTFCVRVEHNHELERKIGGCIKGKVNLKKPDVLFYVFRVEEEFWMCKKIWEVPNREFFMREPKNRPFFMPISIHPKIARAMVNLAGVKKGDVVLDPFCGTGGILIEAGLLGARVVGNDIEEKLVEGAKKNLEFYSIKDYEMFCGDVGEIPLKTGEVDAVVTDPPYGKSATTKKENITSLYERAFEKFSNLLQNGKKLVIVLPFVPNEKIRGFEILEIHKIYVHRSLVRHVCLLERKK
ncbi:MAG: DNA methyltransferase [Thermoplasmata archaeon]